MQTPQRGGAVRLRPVLSVAEIWAFIHTSLLQKYAFIYQGVNVVAGPVFDSNYDGQYDSLETSQQ